ncbi:DUF2255 family protein [Jiangella asiatica]|uniref:DUF2255 family protein n=1 Tax=Jiangella asiatica TaxID=2530372 RepID=A0A4R5CTJ1_9ACTN|nr:DUF2255 family protein [Jiangella asiatica]TDE01033.1 DUF2255 family protein [Jiangella asiatica]
MTNWTEDELATIASTDELRLASRRADGSLRPYVIIWAVRSGGDVYVRSAYGPGNGWYRRALASGTGRVKVGGVERDVTFEAVDTDGQGDIDAAYHAKYDRFGPAIVGTVVGDDAAKVTIRLLPQAV